MAHALKNLANFAAAVLLLTRISHAHRLDEYLQAALVEIGPAEIRLKLNLVPGIQVAPAALWLLDRNRDGILSDDELHQYARSLELKVLLDKKTLDLQVDQAVADSVDELQSGTGTIHIELRAPSGRPARGRHILSFENRHQPQISVYLVNALLPKSPEVTIEKQERNETQSSARIQFKVENPTSEDNALLGVGLGTLIAAFLTLLVWDSKQTRRAWPLL